MEDAKQVQRLHILRALDSYPAVWFDAWDISGITDDDPEFVAEVLNYLHNLGMLVVKGDKYRSTILNDRTSRSG